MSGIKHVGIDLESLPSAVCDFYCVESNCQTLQIATENQVFVFDLPIVMKLSEFQVFLYRLFDNSATLKIGSIDFFLLRI